MSSILTKTIIGPWRFEAERFTTNVHFATDVVRNAIPWEGLRTHVENQFINTDEGQALRNKVAKIKQGHYEATNYNYYSLKFREAAANPISDRNVDQERLLVRAFARGLSSNETARKLDIAPTKLEAITSLAKLTERKNAYIRLVRMEEHMAVNTVNTDNLKCQK